MDKNIKSYDKYISEMARSRDPNKPKRSFADILNSYPKYDVDKLGYGNEEKWRSAFRQKMGYEEAKGILGDMDPYGILGISSDATPEEIKKAYRKRAFETHPDRNPDNVNATKEFQEVQAAYTLLTKED